MIESRLPESIIPLYPECRQVLPSICQPLSWLARLLRFFLYCLVDRSEQEATPKSLGPQNGNLRDRSPQIIRQYTQGIARTPSCRCWLLDQQNQSYPQQAPTNKRTFFSLSLNNKERSRQSPKASAHHLARRKGCLLSIVAVIFSWSVCTDRRLRGSVVSSRTNRTSRLRDLLFVVRQC